MVSSPSLVSVLVSLFSLFGGTSRAGDDRNDDDDDDDDDDKYDEHVDDSCGEADAASMYEVSSLINKLYFAAGCVVGRVAKFFFFH